MRQQASFSIVEGKTGFVTGGFDAKYTHVQILPFDIPPKILKIRASLFYQGHCNAWYPRQGK